MAEVRSRIDWPFHIAQQSKSGLTVREYSKRNGFSVWSFYTNRKCLCKNSLKIKNGYSKPAQFLELGTIHARGGLTISFPNGTSIEFHGPQSTEQLACILDALQRPIAGVAR